MYNLTPSCLTGASKTVASLVDPTTLKNSWTALLMSGNGLVGGLDVIDDSPYTSQEKNTPENIADRIAERKDTMVGDGLMVRY
mmetsp:Transcript_467/g.1194  ORF Transcript_467/g.1194 Transcript_467/m.1194 type:complete len:83 (-) Transcript_467:208-456(-)